MRHPAERPGTAATDPTTVTGVHRGTARAVVPATHCPSCGHVTHARGPQPPSTQPPAQPPAQSRPTLCGTCRDRLVTDLRRLAVLYRRCVDALSPRPTPSLERVSGRRRDGIALDEDVLELRALIRRRLSGWAQLVGAAGRPPVPHLRHVERCVDALVEGLDAVAEHPDAADVVSGVGELVGKALRVLEPDTRERRQLGPCAEPGCGAVVTAVLGPETAVSCAAGHRWAPDRWLRLHAGLQVARARRTS